MNDENRRVLLIFPVNLDASASMVNHAHSLGFKVIGASSVSTPADIYGVDLLVKLPFATEEHFGAAFLELVKEHQITNIYTAHDGVWSILDRLLRSLPVSEKKLPELCHPAPIPAENSAFRQHISWGYTIHENPLSQHIGSNSGVPKCSLSQYQYAGLHRRFTSTFGQCDEDKLAALCAIMRLAPEGDVIEIGSFYGRSALALGTLAAMHGIGSLICIDPWDDENVADQGKEAETLKSDNYRIDWDGVFNSFLSTISQIPNSSYLRMPSAEGIQEYRKASCTRQLVSKHAPPITITGEISILHIDGNHSYKSVKADIDSWLPLLKQGGWLLLDDYTWAFGDGPKRAGDELLESLAFDHPFVSADTLFLQKK